MKNSRDRKSVVDVHGGDIKKKPRLDVKGPITFRIRLIFENRIGKSIFTGTTRIDVILDV
jgi:hypothetical protein